MFFNKLIHKTTLNDNKGHYLLTYSFFIVNNVSASSKRRGGL